MSFLVGVSLNPQLAQEVKMARQVINKYFLKREGDPAIHKIDLNNGCCCAWSINNTADEDSKKFFTHVSNDAFAVIAYGHLLGLEKPAASIIATAYISGGIKAVRNLDFNFGCVIIDRATSQVHFTTDTVGIRPLYYLLLEDSIFLTPYALDLVATGKCSLDPCLETYYSIMRTRWSIGGKPLLNDIKSTKPGLIFTWENGSLKSTFDSDFFGQSRIERNDKKATSEKIDEIIAYMQGLISEITSSCENVKIDLTAGLDTRTIAALILNKMPASSVQSVSWGEDSTTDVKMAGLLASRLGLNHTHLEFSLRPADKLKEAISESSYHTSGFGNAWTAFNFSHQLPGNNIPHFTGHNAGLTKGAYYPDKYGPEPVFKSLEELKSYMSKRVLKGSTLFIHGEQETGLQRRVHETVDMCNRISNIHSDILDMFFIMERVAQFQSANTNIRFPDSCNRICLFEQPRIIALSTQLPPPICQKFKLHRTIVKRYLPETYFNLVNGKTFLPFYSHSFLMRGYRRVNNRVRKLKKSGVPGTHYSPSDHMRTALQHLINETLEHCAGSESLSAQLDPRGTILEKIRNLPNDDLSGRTKLSYFLSAERWFAMAGEVRKIRHQMPWTAN